METKQALSNTFSDGLNTDLHPLITPNTVLTDCINGTIMTNNGNEYNLQNDFGNYELKNAKLPVNYVPIGMKEYNGIIYIVSYNPITKRSQIGTFPSPERLNNKIIEEEVELNQIIINEKGVNSYLDSRTCYYTHYKSQETPTVFNTNDIKINDKFQLDLEGGLDATEPFQEFELYLVNPSGKAVKLDLIFGETVSHKKQIAGQLKLTNTINNLDDVSADITDAMLSGKYLSGAANLDPNRTTYDPIKVVLKGNASFDANYDLNLGFEIWAKECRINDDKSITTHLTYVDTVDSKNNLQEFGITTVEFEYTFEKRVTWNTSYIEFTIYPYATENKKTIVFDNHVVKLETKQLELDADVKTEDENQSLEENES